MDKVFSTPDLISSLASYAEQRRSAVLNQKEKIPGLISPFDDLSTAYKDFRSTTLFLRISAAADYFTTNLTLMQNVPPVQVDISENPPGHLDSILADSNRPVLDPFLLNVFPRSLLPTAGYLALIAIGAWYLSNIIWQCLNRFSQLTETLDDVRDPNAQTAHAKKDI